MKNFVKYGMILFVAALISSSCKKGDSGSGKLSYRVKPANFTASIGSTISGSGLPVVINSNSSLTWISGSLNVSEIDFEAKSKNVEIEYELKQAVNIDLFNLSPILGSITIPVGTYEEVELDLELKKSISNIIPLTLKGSYIDANGAKIPVEFYFNEDFEVEVEAENIVVSANKDYIGLINIQLNKFLTNVVSADLSSATKTAGGVIVISSTSNTELYAKLKANLNAFADCDFDD